MALEECVDLAEAGELGCVEEAATCEYGVECGGGVTLGQEYEIPAGIARVCGVVPDEAAVVQGGEDVDDGE